MVGQTKSRLTWPALKAEKPATPRTDVAPTVGYVLSVDRKLKTQFELSGTLWRQL